MQIPWDLASCGGRAGEPCDGGVLGCAMHCGHDSEKAGWTLIFLNCVPNIWQKLATGADSVWWPETLGELVSCKDKEKGAK